MSEEQEVVEEVVEEAVEERDWLGEAEVMGYHDPTAADYKGDPEKALSPEEFVTRGEEILPIVNANNKKLMAANKKMQDDFNQEKAAFQKHMDTTLKRERAEHEIKLKEAEDDGDFERYKNLKDNEPVEVEKTVEKSPIETEFESRHDWYGTDEKQTKLAQAADNSIQALRGVLSPSEYVDRIEQEMERLMPTKQTHNTVTSSRKKLEGKKTATTFEAMPKENQDACRKMEKDNWGIKREDYVKNYFAGQK